MVACPRKYFVPKEFHRAAFWDPSFPFCTRVASVRSYHKTSPSEFTDDIILDSSHSDPKVVVDKPLLGVGSLAQRLEDIGVILNKKSTQVMFVKPWSISDVQHHVCCGAEALQTVTTSKYLGITTDDNLSWKTHLAQMAAKYR